MRYQTRMKGPTAHGGAYSVVFWQDRHGRPVPQDRAAQIIVVEYLNNGREICRTQAGLESYLLEELSW
ncbi:MAG: hypothetical protein AAFZ80_01305 [Cyanobacteria bacterium P01_A01_bin.105]